MRAGKRTVKINNMNTENNKKIAEFMGHRYDDNRNSHSSSEFYYEDSELEYDTSWDWLMEVVGKIFKKTSINHLHGDLKDALISGDINTTYSIVVAFIDWYNKTQIGAKEN